MQAYQQQTMAHINTTLGPADVAMDHSDSNILSVDTESGRVGQGPSENNQDGHSFGLEATRSERRATDGVLADTPARSLVDGDWSISSSRPATILDSARDERVNAGERDERSGHVSSSVLKDVSHHDASGAASFSPGTGSNATLSVDDNTTERRAVVHDATNVKNDLETFPGSTSSNVKTSNTTKTAATGRSGSEAAPRAEDVTSSSRPLPLADHKNTSLVPTQDPHVPRRRSGRLAASSVAMAGCTGEAKAQSSSASPSISRRRKRKAAPVAQGPVASGSGPQPLLTIVSGLVQRATKDGWDDEGIPLEDLYQQQVGWAKRQREYRLARVALNHEVRQAREEEAAVRDERAAKRRKRR